MKHLKLSACWIARNEQSDIQRSIESVKNQVDELIVVDTGSTYHTGYGSARIESKLRRNLALIELEIARDGPRARHDIALVDCFFGLKEIPVDEVILTPALLKGKIEV